MSTTTSHSHPESSVSMLKRKRSFCSSSPTGSAAAPPAICRTQKRLRARPAEDQIHAYTLQKLFSAAKYILPLTSTPTTQKPNCVSAAPHAHLRSQPQAQHQAQAKEQKTIFSIFGGRSRQPVQAMKQGHMPNSMGTERMTCEDCDSVYIANVSDVDEGRCLVCQRCVCGMGCSTGNGVGRICLDCA